MGKKNYVDFSEAYKALNAKGKNANVITAKAINEAGEIARRTLAVKTPSSGGAGDHAKRHTIKSKATSNNHMVEIGYDKEVAWRMHFVEFGTIKQRPQGFIQSTMESIQAKVQEIIEKAMKEAFLK